MDSVSLYQIPWFKTFNTSFDNSKLKQSILSISNQIDKNNNRKFKFLDNDNNYNNDNSPLSSSSSSCSSFTHIYRVESGFINNIGLVLWPAGYLMADFILDSPELFKSRRLIELGTGIGLTSFIASLAEPKSIIATDFQEKVIDNIKYNFQLNGIGCYEGVDKENSSNSISFHNHSQHRRWPNAPKTSVKSLDWTSHTMDDLRSLGEFDCIIACDTTYIPEILVPFAKTVAELLRIAEERRILRELAGESSDTNPIPIAYLCQTERHPLYFIEYLDALRDEELRIEEINTDHVIKRFLYDRDTIFIHKVTLK